MQLFHFIYTEEKMSLTQTLSDVHILQLSQRLTNVDEVRTLAYRGLKLESHEIEAPINNKPNDIQSAAHEILRTWLKRQTDGEEAYNNMVSALTECKMHQLLSQLQQWGEGKSELTEISTERKSQ